MNKFYLTIVVALFVISCEMEQMSYSCDPQVDSIVKSGAIESSSIDLSEFLEYDIQLQKAIYRSMAPKKKKALWIERFDRIIDSYFFSAEELEHIVKLRTYIVNQSFDFSVTESEPSDVENTFENEWKSVAINKLNWDISKLGFLVSSLYVDEMRYTEIVQDQKELTIQMLNTSCNCSSESNYCQSSGDCHPSGCTQTTGCGWLWQYSCDGNCY